jgi:hypothetical protein
MKLGTFRITNTSSPGSSVPVPFTNLSQTGFQWSFILGSANTSQTKATFYINASTTGTDVTRPVSSTNTPSNPNAIHLVENLQLECPAVNANGPYSSCGNVQLNGMATLGASATWSTNGTGVFSPDANTLNAVYIPSSDDLVNGGVELSLTSQTGNCPVSLHTAIVTFNPVDDNDACTSDGCNTLTGVMHSPVETDDNNICTQDGCDPITGVYHINVNTDDTNVCTEDGCDPLTGIYHTDVNTDDNNACTADGCDSILGVYHLNLNTDDNNICTEDGCDPSAGVFHNNLITDDTNVCTEDGCDPLTGIYHNEVISDDNNMCTEDACNSLTGEITNIEIPVTISYTADPVYCYGDATCITITASGGIPPYAGEDIYCGYTAGNYIFSVTDSRGCASELNVSITQPTKLNVAVSSTPANCFPNSGTATATPSGGTPSYSYLWTPGNFTSQTATGLNPGVYSVSVTDVNGCISTGSVSVASNGVIAGQATEIIGSSQVCKGQCITYSIPPVAGATSYIWTLPNGASGNSTSASISICFNSNFNGGFICVKAVNACGTGINFCKNIIKIKKPPVSPGLIYGPSVVCSNSSTTAVFSVTAVAQATSYIWNVSGGMSILSGQGSGVITVQFPQGFTSGKIKVKSSNCKGVSGERKKDIKGTSLFTPSTIQGQAAVCKSSTHGYSINNVAGTGNIYTWSVSGGAVITSGQGTSNVQVNFNNSSVQNVVLSATVSNVCGTSNAVSKNIAVNLNCRTASFSSVDSGNDVDFTVFPNPTSNKIRINHNAVSESNGTISIINILGKIVYESKISIIRGLNHTDISLDKHADGIYILKYKSDSGLTKDVKIILERN